MNVYRLGIRPSEYDSDGEDFDEWFSSLAEVRQRRAELIRESKETHRQEAAECREWEVPRAVRPDYEIEKIELVDLPTKELALALLNRRRYIAARTIVVPAWKGIKS